MTQEFKTMDGTVQLVIDVKVMERILQIFPGLEAFSIPTSEDDIPTYGLRAKHYDPQAD